MITVPGDGTTYPMNNAEKNNHFKFWCPRSESNRHAFKGGGFSYHFGFRRPGQESRVRGLEHAFTVAVQALGARRLLSTPSPHRALGLARR